MNRFKKICLLFASLFILTASLAAFPPHSANKTTLQNKYDDHAISAILDDEMDDGLDTEQILSIPPYVQASLAFVNSGCPSIIITTDPGNSQLSSYLKVRNLRI